MKKYISLLLVLFLVSGCSFSFNMKNNEEVKEEKKEETSVNTEFYEAAQKIIVNDLLDLVQLGDCGQLSNLDFSKSNKIAANDLGLSVKILIAYRNLYGKKIVETIPKNEFIDSYTKIFNTEPEIDSLMCTSTRCYELDSSTNEYKFSYPAGNCAYKSGGLLDKINVYNDFISFSTINYYVRPAYEEQNADKFYVSNSSFEPTYSFELNTYSPEESDLEKVKSNKDKFTQYRFNFKLNNDHYIFDSVEKIN